MAFAPSASCEQLLVESHEGLRAYFLHFLEVASLGHLAAGCQRLRGALWQDGLFWRAYAGPCLDAEPPERDAPALRSIFRKWLFHLDGAWVKELAQCKEAGERTEFGADYKQLLDDARFFASGLMPCDDDGSSLQEFVLLVGALLSAYNPLQLDERGAAEAAVAQMERRGEVFTDSQLNEISLAYERSVERAVLDQALADDPGSHQDLFFEPTLEDEPDHGLPMGSAPFLLPPEGSLLQDREEQTPSLPSPGIMESFWREAGEEGVPSFGDEVPLSGGIFAEDTNLLGHSPVQDDRVSFWRA